MCVENLNQVRNNSYFQIQGQIVKLGLMRGVTGCSDSHGHTEAANTSAAGARKQILRSMLRIRELQMSFSQQIQSKIEIR